MPDPLGEARRVIDLADTAGLTVRLLGGLAFHARCPEWTARIARDRRDIDLAVLGRDQRAFAQLMHDAGYVGDRQHNALHGHKQMYFVDPVRERPVDVMVDRLEMSHTFEFRDRLTLDTPTLPLADLLLSKLQIAHINKKDILDVLALLAEYQLGYTDVGTINIARITHLTSGDWGWWRTVIENLGKANSTLDADIQPGELEFGRPPRYDPAAQIQLLREAVDRAPKSLRWKARAQVGERVKWYEEPEEIAH